jgi:XTP/dITP diphosphohydrolase
MVTLVFATNNRHKLDEVQKMVGDKFKIVSLADIKCFDEIPETADTLEGNALQKAHFVKENYGYDCFADDTGLEVAALNNEPGVYSARYAGEACSFEDNMNKLLTNLQGADNRSACFRTVIALIKDGEEHLFSGMVKGSITETQQGIGGFGYDPIFMPEGYNQTFSELGEAIKNDISHRAEAVKRLNAFLLK